MLNLDKNKKYLLACSGGPDSMALFSMLLNNGYHFGVVHINYHFRKESDLEEELVRRYASEHGIKIYVLDNKRKVTKNLEAEARKIRYEFFYRVYKENKYDALLIAQHQDDLIETYLMQKRRDLHPKCFGIKDFSFSFKMNIIRPLLSLKKEELFDYCHKNNVPYMIDQSNFDTRYERNDIRQNIVACLSKKDRDKLLLEIDNRNEEINCIFSRLQHLDIHSCKALNELSDLEKVYAIQELANECQIFKISKENLSEILKIITSNKPNIVLRYKDYSFVKEYDHIYFSNYLAEVSYSYVLKEPGKLDTPYFYLDFSLDSTNRNVSVSDYPLTIRNAHKKDKVKIKDYYKECRRLFIDWKMPLSLRNRWPIIVNKDNQIVYIPRYQKDFSLGKNLNFYVK